MTTKLLQCLILSIFLAGCGYHNGIPGTTKYADELLEKQEWYQANAKYGWEQYDYYCDALLFASLSAVAVDKEIDIRAAQIEPGRFVRNPNIDCYEEKGSDVSRDMYMGLFVYIYHFKKLDIAKEIYDYGERNNWVFGRTRNLGDNSNSFTPGMVSLLANIIYRLGGERSSLQHIPNIYSAAPNFSSHLSLLHLYLEGRMQGYLTPYQLSELEKILKHRHGNPFAQALYHKYTDGNQDIAAKLLIDIWPTGRLPNSTDDWVEEWRHQRADTEEWFLSPADPAYILKFGTREHGGACFLFASKIIYGEL